MEAIFFMIDIFGILLVLYWSIVNDKQKPDSPTTGLFAYRKTLRRRPTTTALRPPPPRQRRSR